MINYKNAIYKEFIYHNDNHLELLLRCFQDLVKQKFNKSKEVLWKCI